jgi:hypothetical protein
MERGVRTGQQTAGAVAAGARASACSAVRWPCDASARRRRVREARANAFDDAEANLERYMDSIKSRDVIREKRSARRINRMLECKDAYSVMQNLAIIGAVQYWAQRGVKVELPVHEVD